MFIFCVAIALLALLCLLEAIVLFHLRSAWSNVDTVSWSTSFGIQSFVRQSDELELSIEMQCVSMASGGRGRGRGGRDKDRDQKPLTKEALDADLDEVKKRWFDIYPWVFRVSIEVYITFLMAFFSHDFCFSVQFGTLSSSV